MSERTRRILVIEDDESVLEHVCALLEDEGCEALPRRTAEEGVQVLEEQGVSVVLTDLFLPGSDGFAVIRRARELDLDAPVLVMTAHASVETAVRAMGMGAFHYIEKPFSAEALLAQVEKAVAHGEALAERRSLRKVLSHERGVGRILGPSAAMEDLRSKIRRVAGADATVFVVGETGTGKELVADALHYEGARAGGPLVKVNCAALAEQLLESELFGHEKGAFTGADRSREGKFERADGGTLFLDEITEMNGGVQAKLLRVLQGAPFERVGGGEPIRSDVRIVAATNRDPRNAVEEGKLRQDLYYRLHVMRLEVPPLRERTEDVPVLARAFLAKYASRHGRSVRDFSEDAVSWLSCRAWEGNVRELENTVERAVLLSPGPVLGRDDLEGVLEASEGAGGTVARAFPTLDLKEMERLMVLQALEESGWVKAEAARKLGIYPASLYKKMRRMGIPQNPEPERDAAQPVS